MEASVVAVDGHALFLRLARRADIALREVAVAAIDPAVGASDEGVERFVRVLPAPTIEQNLRRAVGLARRGEVEFRPPSVIIFLANYCD